MTKKPISETRISKNQLKISNLDFAFIPDKKILKNISLSLKKGEWITLMGENGSGKSTLFLCILNLLNNFSGKIKVEGKLVNKKNEKNIRKIIGIMFQDPNDQLFLPTVQQELEFGLINLGIEEDMIKKRIEETIKALNIKDLQTKKTFHLSYGEKKKIAFATIYAMDPEIFLLDEPYANLDPQNKKELNKILCELHQNGKSIICISHELEHIPKFAKRAVVLNKGEIIFDGSIRYLYQNQKLLQRANLEVPIISKLYKNLINFIEMEKEQTIPIPIYENEFIDFLKDKLIKTKLSKG